MFSEEECAMPIIDKAVDKYEKHFQKVFPLYEYIDITRNKSYDFSVEGAHRLEELINGCFETNVPVDVPEDYSSRMY